MQQWVVDDPTDDFQSSFNSTKTIEINRSTSSGSETMMFDSKQVANRKLGIEDLRLVKRLGCGDIGSVYLAELKGIGGCIFAAKVMDKKELVSREKEVRAETEREILEMLDHPFLPTLYAYLESNRWSCLLTEFCPGGDLHILRQLQPRRRFNEAAVRFYASEIVAAVEYLHMLGIVYRDLKPENVLVRGDGHIMLTDFDLSLKCDNYTSTPQLVSHQMFSAVSPYGYKDRLTFTSASCIFPNCIVPAITCFKSNLKRKKRLSSGYRRQPKFVAEPIDVRSMSYVGTHEYLAPEVATGEGHGSAVDWWTLGIFMFELLYGVTPFKGMNNDLTVGNIVARALEFPKEPSVSTQLKDIIAQLLVKNPTRRMGSTLGATAIKHHPFFRSVNWALLRCATPPYVPPPFSTGVESEDSCPDTPIEYF
ncbi:hypothetical protein GIB67_012940 [Kingdonia uniflora]|uniref:non-specific serine/threonine protein kinase n=1 Tax=Kingdonia uniflora TaxID=39325 RepID=A0A7J7NG66_9MAGN|nr:hypothetical protein GIB67_012940 [Kingdonia uniflora]